MAPEPLDEITADDILADQTEQDSSVSDTAHPFGSLSNPISANADLRNIIVSNVKQAWLEADDEPDSNCAPFHRGMLSFLLQVKYLTPLLSQFGFVRQDAQGQVRFVNSSWHPAPIRLLFCRGFKVPNGYDVCPKGNRSRDLIEGENQEWLHQTSMFDDEFEDTVEGNTDQVFQNYWIISEFFTQGSYLTIYLVLPVYLSPSGVRMNTVQSINLFSGSLSAVEPVAVELPAAQEINFSISEADSPPPSGYFNIEDNDV